MGVVQGAKTHEVEGKPSYPPKSRERVVKDPTFVSDAKRKEYGVKPDEEVYWARDASYWAQFEMGDRQDELMADVEDGGVNARVVYKNGEFDKVHIGGNHGDLILMAYPKEIRDQIQAECDDARTNYEADLYQTDQGYESHQDLFDRSNLDRRMRAEHEFHVRSGLAGGNSPTAGLSFMEAAALMKQRGVDVEARQEMLRMGNQHTDISQEDFGRLITGQKKLHGMGNSGLGKTTQQKVAARGNR